MVLLLAVPRRKAGRGRQEGAPRQGRAGKISAALFWLTAGAGHLRGAVAFFMPPARPALVGPLPRRGWSLQSLRARAGLRGRPGGWLEMRPKHPTLAIRAKDRRSAGIVTMPPTRAAQKKERKELEARLDAALEDTFPASDPIAVGRPTGTERPRRPSQDKAPAGRRPQARSSRR